MGLCGTCNNLRVDSTTNETAEESSRPEAERLLTYYRNVPIREWHCSAEAGCITCRLIWDIINHVDEKLASELTRSHKEGEEQAYIWLDGMIGKTLTLILCDMPPGKYFPALELYSAKSMEIRFAPSCTIRSLSRQVFRSIPLLAAQRKLWSSFVFRAAFTFPVAGLNNAERIIQNAKPNVPIYLPASLTLEIVTAPRTCDYMSELLASARNTLP
jgi:hypothetical protein